jgi:hypothetical protein
MSYSRRCILLFAHVSRFKHRRVVVVAVVVVVNVVSVVSVVEILICFEYELIVYCLIPSLTNYS